MIIMSSIYTAYSGIRILRNSRFSITGNCKRRQDDDFCKRDASYCPDLAVVNIDNGFGAGVFAGLIARRNKHD